MKIINLTTAAITICKYNMQEEDQPISPISVAPSGMVAGFVETEHGCDVPLPPKRDGIVYVVPNEVAINLHGERDDVFGTKIHPAGTIRRNDTNSKWDIEMCSLVAYGSVHTADESFVNTSIPEQYSWEISWGDGDIGDEGYAASVEDASQTAISLLAANGYAVYAVRVYDDTLTLVKAAKEGCRDTYLYVRRSTKPIVRIVNLSSSDIVYGPSYGRRVIPRAQEPLDITQRANDDGEDTVMMSALMAEGYSIYDARWGVKFDRREKDTVYVVDEHIALQMDRTWLHRHVYTAKEIVKQDDKMSPLMFVEVEK